MRLLFPSAYPLPAAQNIPFPTFVTITEREEFHKVENKTINTIKILAQELINELDCDSIQAHYKDMWRKVKSRRKDDLIDFYYKLKEVG